jgi:hypothetical protein
MDLYNPLKFYQKEYKEGLSDLWDNGKWINVYTAAKYLTNFSFFKRIPFEKLAEILPFISLKEKRKGDVIFVEDYIAILLNGRVILRSHEMNGIET